MKSIYIKIIGLAFSLLPCLAWNVAGQQSPQAVADTIPFEYRGSKIVISTSLNGKPADFIVDTGGRNFIVADSAAHYGFERTGQETVGDANLTNLTIASGVAPELALGTKMKWNAASFLLLPQNNFYSSLGVAGALGGEAFASVCLTIDAANRCLIITYPYRPRGLARSSGVDMEMGDHNYAIVPMSIGGSEIPVLFDTGVPGFFSVGERDLSTLTSSGSAQIAHRGYGFTAVGVAGIAGTKNDSLSHVEIGQIELGGKLFRNVGSIVEKRPNTIMGREALEYGKVVIDYPRGLFFFIPHDDSPSDMRGATLVWNVKILPVGNTFHLTATIGAVDAAVGERVWKIDGRDLAGVPNSEQAIEDIMNGIEGHSAQIIVGETLESTRSVTINKI